MKEVPWTSSSNPMPKVPLEIRIMLNRKEHRKTPRFCHRYIKNIRQMKDGSLEIIML